MSVTSFLNMMRKHVEKANEETRLSLLYLITTSCYSCMVRDERYVLNDDAHP
jgi:hypothetical protein